MNEIPKTYGEYPPVLFRILKKEHALDFVKKGIIRFGSIEFYRQIEDDNRRDETEGKGSYTIPGTVVTLGFNKNGKITAARKELGEVHYRTEYANRIYVLCCSYPYMEHRLKNDECIVRINDSQRFGQELTDNLWNSENRCIVECVKVSYDKNHLVSKELAEERKHELAYSQKPEKFWDQNEYRLVIMLEPSVPDDFFYVDIGKALSYAEILTLEYPLP